jgi:hypothetical protein
MAPVAYSPSSAARADQPGSRRQHDVLEAGSLVLAQPGHRLLDGAPQERPLGEQLGRDGGDGVLEGGPVLLLGQELARAGEVVPERVGGANGLPLGSGHDQCESPDEASTMARAWASVRPVTVKRRSAAGTMAGLRPAVVAGVPDGGQLQPDPHAAGP